MRRVVTFGLVVLALVLIAFDVYLDMNSVPGDTYSEIIRDAGFRVVALPWAIGALVGHWFWNGTRYSNRFTWALVIVVAIGMEVLNYFGLWHPLPSALVGICSGRLVWSAKGPSK